MSGGFGLPLWRSPAAGACSLASPLGRLARFWENCTNVPQFFCIMSRAASSNYFFERETGADRLLNMCQTIFLPVTILCWHKPCWLKSSSESRVCCSEFSSFGMAMSGKGDIAFYEKGERLDREWHAVQGTAQEPRRARAGTRLEKNGRTVERKEGGGQRKTGAFLKFVREDDEPVLVRAAHQK